MSEAGPCFLDTCIPLYAAGADHPYRQPCLEILAATEDARLAAVTNTEVVQEIVHRLNSIGRQSQAIALASDFIDIVETILPVTRVTVVHFLEMQEAYPDLPSRDALHLATMIESGVKLIVTADKHFDAVREVRRIDPLDFRW